MANSASIYHSLGTNYAVTDGYWLVEVTTGSFPHPNLPCAGEGPSFCGSCLNRDENGRLPLARVFVGDGAGGEGTRLIVQ